MKSKEKVRPYPKGRPVDAGALEEVRVLLGDEPRRRDLLIEHLHKINDRYGHLSAAHLAALAQEMALSQTEVYEVATFYHHFEVVKEGEAPPPSLTVRVCDSIACELAGADALLERLPSILGKDVRVVHAPCVGRCEVAPVAVVGQNPVGHATVDTVKKAVEEKQVLCAETRYIDFAAYKKGGGYKLISDCLDGKHTREALTKIMETTEFDIQQRMAGWFRDEGLVSDSDPNVSAAANAGNPHYLPTASTHRPIRKDEVVLLDLWGKLDRPGAVFADITWMGFSGRDVPQPVARAFDVVCRARDAAAALVRDAARAGREVRGWEVDRAASSVLRAAGYAANILHRTGHSLGETVHGNGVNMDDYETHDDRRLLPGTGFTIEPGLYFDDFGVRTEINMVVGTGDATVTGPLQTEIVTLT